MVKRYLNALQGRERVAGRFYFDALLTGNRCRPGTWWSISHRRAQQIRAGIKAALFQNWIEEKR